MSRMEQGLQRKRIEWRAVANAFLLALAPIFGAWMYCELSGIAFSQIFLPASSWNDELFYYKMTENVIAYGYPQGYFGFNESHGLYLSFAAWSPVLLLFWVIWGLFFGWNLLSPMFCNIALLTIAVLLFGILVKPDQKQGSAIAALYMTFLPVSRFALSCIPEAELFALFIVFLGLAIACHRKYRDWMIGAMFVLVMLMTWMRPYLILLLLTPAAELFSRKGRKALLPTAAFGGVTVAVYMMINHFFSAPYLTDLFYTEWIKVYFEQGILAGVSYTVRKLHASFGEVLNLIRANLTVKSGLVSAAGLYYFIFLLLLLLLLARAVWRLLYKNWKGFLPEGQMLLCMTGFFAADLLMYRIQEGGRHTLVYIVGLLFLIPLADLHKKRSVYLSFGIAVFFTFLFLLRGNVPYEFALPRAAEERRTDLESLAGQLAENMELTGEAPNYDNTVIWVFSEQIDGISQNVDFGAYYAVPEGFGINLCDGGYTEANLETLQSRYIGVTPGGDFEKRCIAAGGKEAGRCRSLVVYDMKSAGEK